MAAPAFPVFPRTHGLNGAAVVEQRPIVINDVRNDSRYLTTFGTTLAEAIVPVQLALDVTYLPRAAGYRQTISPSSIALPISAPAPAPTIAPSVFDPPGAMMCPSAPPAIPPRTSPVVPSSRRQ